MKKPSKEDLLLIPAVTFGLVMIVLTIISYAIRDSKKSETSMVTETTTTTSDVYQPQIDDLKKEISRLESKIDAMSTTTTTTTTETTTSTTTTTVTTTQTTQTVTEAKKTDATGLTKLGTFKGTYYAGKTVPCKGGSGRTLIDCTTGSNGIKGSVASKLVYQNYGYKRNGERTKIYIEIASHPSMNGWYYVDDCNSTTSIIDFYFYKNSNCPWSKAGVVSVTAYI